MKSHSLLTITLFSVILTLSGCDKINEVLEGNWLVGTWTVDREKTMQVFKEINQRDNPRGGLAGELAATAIRKTIETSLRGIDNVKVVITDKEITEVGQNLATAPRTYEIVSRPAENQIKILDSDNNVRIYHRDGEHIWHYIDSNETFRVYLKPLVR